MIRGKQIACLLLGGALTAGGIMPVIPASAGDTTAQTETKNTETAESKEVKEAEAALQSDNSLPSIRLSVGNGQETPQYTAGQQVELTLKVENQGSTAAENVRITPVIDNAADWPFEIGSMNYEQNLGSVEAGSTVEAKWSLTVRTDVESKNYKTPFHITYDDGEKEYAVDKYIFVKTTAQEKQEQKEEEKTDTTQDETQSGGTAAVETYTDDSGSVYNGETYSSGGSTSANPSVPRVIVTGFATDPGTVNAGNNFRLTIHVKNTSSSTAVSNLLFDLQAPASGSDSAAEAPAFLPASGASSIFLDKIPAGETRDIAIDLNARADLTQKPYSITVSMQYEDGNANQYESSSSVAIPVQQAARFELSDITLSPADITVGDQSNLTCSIYNTGRTKMYNVKASFSGDGISAGDVFVGNLDSGGTGTIDAMLTGESEMLEGTVCKMTISYEDESGNVTTSEEEFSMSVSAEAAVIATDMAEVEVEQQSFPVVPAVVGIIAVAAVITVVVILRRKKKKLVLSEEEDLVNEVDRFTEDE